MNPGAVMRNIIPVIMAGVLGIYGLIVAIIILGKIEKPGGNGEARYEANTGYAHLSAGLCCGLSCLGAGYAIGLTGDAGARAVARVPSLYVPFILVQIFGEALALYGLIVALVLSQK